MTVTMMTAAYQGPRNGFRLTGAVSSQQGGFGIKKLQVFIPQRNGFYTV